MFCPECRAEYQPGYTKCSDCDIDLVLELPPLTPPEFLEFDEVLSTNSPSDVAFLKSILDEDNMTYFFQGEHVAPYVYHALPMRLMIRRDQVLRAMEILKDFNQSLTFGGLLKTDTDKEKEET
jgi:hypothetical protein